MIQVREFLLRLALCPGLSPLSRWQLWQAAEKVRAFNDLGLLVECSQISLRAQNALFRNWESFELREQVQRNMKQDYLMIVDDEYPAQLREIFCPPVVLFYQGDVNLLRSQGLAVVGARQMTSYGSAVLKGLLPQVIKRGITVVSGLAAGVDGLSHEITLQNRGKTIGVIGCGLDQVYPRNHQELQRAVAKEGLVISEYGLGVGPLAFHFPERNRLIAGLAETVLVVEAKKRSGSLITANIALEENRNVCAIPGRIDAPLSLGCNQLIAAGAKPITEVSDLLAEFL